MRLIRVLLLCLVLLATSRSAWADGGARAKWAQDRWELALGAAGDMNTGVDAGAVGTHLGLGFFLVHGVELSARETFFYSSFPNGTNWMSTTEGAATFQFDWGKFHPYLGAEGGYGVGVHNTSSFEIGPVGGIKFDFNNRVFIFADAEYDDFVRPARITGGIRSSAILFSIGVGVRF